jgi:hypothetical protein
MMKQEDQIENDGRGQLQDGQNPDDQSEKHTKQNHGLQVIVFSKYFDVIEELQDWGTPIVLCMLTPGD